MIYGILKRDIECITAVGEISEDYLEYLCEDDKIFFTTESKVEILRTIHDDTYVSKLCYVILDPETNESLSVDSSFVELINEEQ